MPASPLDSATESREGRNVTEIAKLLAERLSYDEMYDLVLAIESSNLHASVIQQWKHMRHPNVGN
jgi:hypothetical protein